MTAPTAAQLRAPAPLPFAVVCDFDGTATLLDLGDEISIHFGGRAHWEAERARFLSGELNTRGIIEAIYTRVFAPQAEIEAFAVARAQLRPGFAELVAACRAAGVPFLLASGGLRQYIEPVLRAHLPPELASHVEVRANEAVFRDGQGLRVEFPGASAASQLGCQVCGSCKRVSVAEARARGAAVVLGVGDGFADRCLVASADRSFVRRDSYLHRYCVEGGIAHQVFEDLGPAVDCAQKLQRG